MSVVAKISTIVWLSLCLTLTACGGGGSSDDGGGSTEDPTNEQPGGDDSSGDDSSGDDGGDSSGDGNTDGGDSPGDDNAGDDSGDGDDAPEPPPEGAPIVSVAAELKRLTFSWDAQEQAENYVLSHNPDGASGFSELATIDEGTETSIDIAVHDYDVDDAAFIVEACAPDGCVPSPEVTPTDALLDAIGYIKPNNPGALDEFGQSVAISDDGRTLVVGAHREQGSGTGVNPEADDALEEGPGGVYVFSFTDGGWLQQAYIKPPIADTANDFGHRVAVSGDGQTLAIGATWGASPESGQGNIGTVDIYTLATEGWTHQQTLEASNAQASGQFGLAIALSDDGNALAAGAPGEVHDGAPTDSADWGAAYLFTRTDGQWSEAARLVAPNAEAGDLFGGSVALSGDASTLAVGAVGESSSATGVGGDQLDNNAGQAGAVYVFTAGEAGWEPQPAYLKSTTTAAANHFGHALAISDDGNWLAVSAVNEDSEAGAVHLFNRNAGSWSDQARLSASNASDSDSFGDSLAMTDDGSMIAVGATWEDGIAPGVGGDEGDGTDIYNTGAAYLFERANDGWTQTAYINAINPQLNAHFGHSLAISASGDTLAVSALTEDGGSAGVDGDIADQTAEDAGAVYLY